MKRKTREEKAITLIALIITIVVLLILAVVAINAVTGDGIIQHASNAKTEYEKAQAEEQGTLSYYQEYLNTKGDLGPWKQDGNKIYMTDSNGETTEIEIGAIVNYDCYTGVEDSKLKYTSSSNKTGLVENQTFTITSSDMTWQVLGIEDGKILLISDYIKSDENTGYALNAKDGCKNGVSELNNICAIYGHGRGAESARSIKVEDINKITGYNPVKTGNGKKFNEGQIDEYGLQVTYSLNNSKIAYKSTIAESDVSDFTSFTTTYDIQVTSENSIRVTNSIYSYYPRTLTTSSESEDKGILNDVEYSMLFKDGTEYWYATLAEGAYSGTPGRALYGLFVFYNNKITFDNLWTSDGMIRYPNYAIRAVARLSSNIELTKSGDTWDINI